MDRTTRARTHTTAGLIAGPGSLLFVVAAAVATADLGIATSDAVLASCALAAILAHGVSLLELAFATLLLRRQRWPTATRVLGGYWIALVIAIAIEWWRTA